MAKQFRLDFVATGIPEFDQALSALGNKTEIRRVVRPPAVKGLGAVRREAKRRSQRTHPRSMSRDPVGQVLTRAGKSPKSPAKNPNSRIGPMSRYTAVRAISARSKFVGAKLIYDSRKFPGFVVTGKRSKKRAFYPASQEYGAKADPPIKKKGQMAGSAASQGRRALAIFRREFVSLYERRTKQILRRKGNPRV